MGINILDNDTINKIAAGEVVERPASIVKELTENAIDADASAVTIEIRDGGQALIRVTDNGCGIPKEDVRNAFLRHATSKISTAEDLKEIRSLGFRGEALSSIAAVCRTEIITKTRAALTGTRYVVDGGVEKAFEEVGAPEGTTVIARDIFFHTPVRRKFLKSPATEAAHVAELAEQLALSHPEVSIRFIVNGQSRFHTNGSGRLKEVIYQLYGREIANALIEIDTSQGGYRVRGFLGKPEVSRGSRALEHYCVNGRYIKSGIIAKAIEDGYGNLMMQHSFPFCVLLIDIDPAAVDVNVHPTKREIRFSDSQAVYDFLKMAVERALKGKELIRDVSLAPAGKTAQKPAGRQPRPAEPFETKRAALEEKRSAGSIIRETAGDSGERAGRSPENRKIAWNTPEEYKSAAETGSQTGRTVIPEEPQKNEDAKAAVETPAAAGIDRTGQYSFLDPAHRAEVRLAGEVFGTYWIAEWNDAMYIIDQHAAHEKVNYERFMKAWKEQSVVSQQLLPPAMLTLSDREAALLERHMESFSSLGYEIEHFGGHEYAVRAVPDLLPSVMKGELLKEMIGSLSEEGGSAVPTLIIEKTASMSCKAAVKGNTSLSAGEAEKLLDELFALEDPYNCPHGRPTIIRLTRSELDRRFRRVL